MGAHRDPGRGVKRLLHRQLYGCDGGIIGTICDVITVDDPAATAWLVVDTGVLSPRRAVPAGTITDAHGRLSTPYPGELVRLSPVDAEQSRLDTDAVRRLEQHYGVVPDVPA